MDAKILMLKGEKGDPGGSTWGNIDGTLSDQTDLKTALDAKAATSELGAAAFSNDYDDLDNKPAFKTVATSGSYNDLANKPNFADVALTGSYNDLTNRPTIPTMDQLLNLVHPIGSYYWSENSTNPGSIFGGTWEQIKDRFILAAGDAYTAGATGGEATHRLSTDEMPSHRHYLCDYDYYYRVLTDSGTNGVQMESTSEKKSTLLAYIQTRLEGGSEAHNNMPPYLVAYCFKRTA